MMDIGIVMNRGTNSPIEFDLSGEKVSGIELLAQRVLVILLTNVNEVLRSSEGSSFIRTYGNTQSSSEFVSLIFASALSDVINIIKKDNSSDDPSEILADATATVISVSEGSVQFNLNVYSASGEVSQILTSAGV